MPIKTQRTISKIPYKVLDAPSLQDDFYLNLVDWSSKNALAVGLGSCAYIWSAQNGKVTKLNDVGPSDSIASINWSKDGQYLGVGTFSGSVQIWDINNCQLVKVNKGHDSRVGSIAWSSKMLATGSRDKSIILSDLRDKRNITKLTGHKQEVCGLKWSSDEQQLASGGNDNKLLVWGANNLFVPAFKFYSHIAAVKALAWSPHQHALLVSGGGTADKTIRFWNTLTGVQLNCVDTGSQVCNLAFAKNANELISTHGYSQNQIHLWKYPTMRKIATLTGHTFRVLYLALSNDGESIVTGAGDETLRFWKISSPQKKKETFCDGVLSLNLH
jgi:cell division cycle 20-like protein 1 (cofactor of APC complex)